MALQSLRIGLIGPLPPPYGGMANQTQQLSELLAAAGAKVTLVQVNAPYRPSWTGNLPGLRSLFRLVPYLMALWRAAGSNDFVSCVERKGMWPRSVEVVGLPIYRPQHALMSR